MRVFSIFLLVFAAETSFSADEFIYNSAEKKGVMDLSDDPNEIYTPVYLLCYKGSDLRVVLDRLRALAFDGVILSDPEVDLYVNSTVVAGKLIVLTYSSKVENEGGEPMWETEIPSCMF